MRGKLKACRLPELNQGLSIQPVRFEQINSLNAPTPARIISLPFSYYYLDIPSVPCFHQNLSLGSHFFFFLGDPLSLPSPPHTPCLSYFKCGKKGRTKRDKMTDVTVNLANELRGSR